VTRTIIFASLLLVACDKTKPPPPRPELINVVRALADRACACETDKDCLKQVRAEFDPQKFELQKHGLIGEQKATFDAELLRLRACGDAGGVTIWLN
jgi:hypothetical protein